MPDPLLVILNGPLSKRRLIDHFADVLENEVVRLQVGIRSQSESFLVGLDDRYIGVLFPLKTLILTSSTTGAVSVNAFHFSCPIDAI
jgi:hypothetical protein